MRSGEHLRHIEKRKKEKVKENKFIFKGGTALLLLMKEPVRLSIDLDIIISGQENDLDSELARIISYGNFIRVEQQERVTDYSIKKAHYKFYYHPLQATPNKENYILLDILFEKDPYKTLNEIPVVSRFLVSTGEPSLVKIPSFEDILGDKLTAFAPNTTGVPYLKKGHGMGMKILKQLFDIGYLFDIIHNIAWRN